MKGGRPPPLGAAASAMMADQSNTFDRMVIYGYDPERYARLMEAAERENARRFDVYERLAALHTPTPVGATKS